METDIRRTGSRLNRRPFGERWLKRRQCRLYPQKAASASSSVFEHFEEIARHLCDERRPCFESAATSALRPLQITHPISD